MSQALVRPLLLAGCLHGVFAECNVYLETETMKGPGVCTEDGVAAMTAPEDRGSRFLIQLSRPPTHPPTHCVDPC